MQLTIRGVDPELKERLSRQAAERDMSVNRLVLRLLRQGTGAASPDVEPQAAYDDLDHLAGCWSAEEGERFDEALRAQKAIDEDMWR